MKVYDKLRHSIRYWLLRRLPACEEIVKDISQAMDQRPSLATRLKVRIHLWVCAWCQWYYEHLHLIRQAARAKGSAGSELPESQGGSHLSAEARERIKRSLKQQ